MLMINICPLEIVLMLPNKIQKRLSERTIRRITNTNGIRAAVLVPIFEKDNSYQILFTKRTNKVRHHKGQISFPGGSYDETDKALENTALRETLEEIGIGKKAIRILGELDETRTVTSNYIVSAYVGYIDYSQITYKIQEDEIDELIEVPLTALLEPSIFREELITYEDKKRSVLYYHYEHHVIWGATARILKQLLDILAPYI